MFSQEEIDAVLGEAQSAVEDLARDVGNITAPSAPAPPVSLPPVPIPPPRNQPPRVDRILKIRVPVWVRLAERLMPIGDVLRIAPGTILEFDRNVGTELDLMVNNREIGAGQAVKVNEHFGIRITSIGNVSERISLLGGR